MTPSKIHKIMEKSGNWDDARPYNQVDHSHCWSSKNPPCGQKIEHLKCCLCEMLNPKAMESVRSHYYERVEREARHAVLEEVEQQIEKMLKTSSIYTYHVPADEACGQILGALKRFISSLRTDTKDV